MKKFIKVIVVSVFFLAGLLPLPGQTIISNDSIHSNRAYIKPGIDPGTVITFGYERKLGLMVLENHLVTYAEWNASAIDFGNSELKIGGILPVYEKGNFRIVNNLNLSAATLATKHFDSKKFALGDEVALGFYKTKWFFALTAEYEKVFLNYLEHSDFFRETYYEDAVDGWYKGGGGNFQFGFEIGRTFIDKLDVHLEMKVPFTEKFNSLGGSPAHINLGIGYRF
jgi:hypothetical protein